MGSFSKRKGYRYEKELTDQASDAGLEAMRAWGSNGNALGEHKEVDLMVEHFKLQAKRRKRISKYIKPSEHVNAQVIREDYGDSYAIIRYEDFLDLVAKAKGQ